MARHPVAATKGSSGYDCFADVEQDVVMYPGDTVIIPLGFILKIPRGYEGQVRSRSGLAAKQQVVVLNSPGTIDSDYEGEVKAIMYNASMEMTRYIKPGDKICQIVIVKIEPPVFVLDAERGDGGFGSTDDKET